MLTTPGWVDSWVRCSRSVIPSHQSHPGDVKQVPASSPARTFHFYLADWDDQEVGLEDYTDWGYCSPAEQLVLGSSLSVLVWVRVNCRVETSRSNWSPIASPVLPALPQTILTNFLIHISRFSCRKWFSIFIFSNKNITYWYLALTSTAPL